MAYWLGSKGGRSREAKVRPGGGWTKWVHVSRCRGWGAIPCLTVSPSKGQEVGPCLCFPSGQEKLKSPG